MKPSLRLALVFLVLEVFIHMSFACDVLEITEACSMTDRSNVVGRYQKADENYVCQHEDSDSGTAIYIRNGLFDGKPDKDVLYYNIIQNKWIITEERWFCQSSIFSRAEFVADPLDPLINTAEDILCWNMVNEDTDEQEQVNRALTISCAAAGSVLEEEQLCQDYGNNAYFYKPSCKDSTTVLEQYFHCKDGALVGLDTTSTPCSSWVETPGAGFCHDCSTSEAIGVVCSDATTQEEACNVIANEETACRSDNNLVGTSIQSTCMESADGYWHTTQTCGADDGGLTKLTQRVPCDNSFFPGASICVNSCQGYGVCAVEESSFCPSKPPPSSAVASMDLWRWSLLIGNMAVMHLLW